MEWYGGIEAGGTKFNCIIAHDPDHILAETIIPTTTPVSTIPEVIRFFKENTGKLGITLESMGIACFGPVNLDKNSPGFGTITSTPKTQWKNTPILKLMQNELNLPIEFDTDVNGAALGEGKWGAGAGISDFIYITIGTGIGGGIIANKIPVHGLIHPELGHIFVKHDVNKDPFEGVCPYHKDCFEGLASGPSIAKRWGIPAQDLPPEHPAWDLEAEYIGQAIHSLCLTCSPKRIILGGGVMKVPGLLEKIRMVVHTSLNGYIDSEMVDSKIDSFLVSPELGDRAGELGAIVLASNAQIH